MNWNNEDLTGDHGNDASIDGLVTLARREISEGNYERALAVAARALHLGADCIEAHEVRATLHQLGGEWSSVVEDCTQLIRLRPTNPEHYCDRAYAYNQLGQYERAVLDCNKALETDSGLARAYMNRGYALNQLGRCSESDADARRGVLLVADLETIAERDHKELIATLLRRAQALIAAGRCNEAVEACSAILCDEPEHSEARRLRGIAYQHLSRLQEACADLAEASRLMRDHYHSARVYVVTLEGNRGEIICAAFPDGDRAKANDWGAQLATNPTTQDVESRIGAAVVANIYRIEGTTVEKADWIWINDDDGEQGPPAVIDLTPLDPT